MRVASTAPSVVHLELAGTLRVACAGVERTLAPLDAALLAWLALEGPTPRARLAQLLWPDKEPDAARNSLRQRLFHLRKTLDVELVEGSATLSLAPGVSHDLDDADTLLGPTAGETLAPGEFTQWLQAQRARRRDRVRAAFAELADAAEAAKDWDDALTHARELIALEPLSEAAHRRLMRLHYLRGDRAAALLAFDDCERVLKDEVGARPSHETLQLLATIESSSAGASIDAPPAPPASVFRPPRLVGRERELATLRQALQAGQVVALIGEAGLGKTRLLQEFVANEPDALMACGRPGDAGVPFATLARLLRALVQQAGGAHGGLLTTATRAEVARVLPEFDAGGVRQAGEGQRLVLLRAVRALMDAGSSASLIVVDDLHFADDASIDLLAHLIDGADARAPTAGRRWVVAWRPAEGNVPLQGLHDRLVEQVRLAPLPLQPLDEAALAQLVDSLSLPGVSGAALAPGLLRRTGGNPLFVLETLKQAWVEQTLAQLADADSMPRPPSVGRLIERRVARLSPGALALARVASIAGVDFCIGMAESVLGASALQFADALNELEAAQVMRDTQFAHDLVYEAVRQSVPAAIARHTHQGVAAWLERHGGEPARIARHWVEGGQGLQAVPWLGKAAEAAGAGLRLREQIAFLDEKSRIEQAAQRDDEAFDTLIDAAERHVTLDGDDGQGAAMCDRLDALARTPAQRVRSTTQRAHLAIMRGELDAAIAHAESALREAIRHGVDAVHVTGCRQQFATALSMADRLPEAIVQFEAMMTWVDSHGSDSARCEFHANLAMTLDQAGRLADGVPHHERAIALAQSLHHHGNTTMCLANFGANRILGGRLREAEALLARARALRTQADDENSIDGFIALNQAICDYASGRYRSALEALDQSLARFDVYAPGFRAAAEVHQAACWAQLGQWARVQQLADRLSAVPGLPGGSRARLSMLRHQMARALGEPSPGDALSQAPKLAEMASLHDLRDAALLEIAATQQEAGDALEAALSIAVAAERLGHDGTVIAARAQAAWCAARVGHADLARTLVQEVEQRQQTAQVVRQYALQPRWHCAQALAAIGERAQARAMSRRALEWVETTASEQVPEPFRRSFLDLNPINRELRAYLAHGG